MRQCGMFGIARAHVSRRGRCRSFGALLAREDGLSVHWRLRWTQTSAFVSMCTAVATGLELPVRWQRWAGAGRMEFQCSNAHAWTVDSCQCVALRGAAVRIRWVAFCWNASTQLGI